MKIFVENLTHSVTNNDLIKLFELSGFVESVTIVNDKFSGKPGGFVEMPNRLEALEMIKNLNGVTLFGTTLILSAMREKIDRRTDASERRIERERRADENRRIDSERRKKKLDYAFDDRRTDPRRNSGSDRRELSGRRSSSDQRAGTDRRI